MRMVSADTAGEALDGSAMAPADTKLSAELTETRLKVEGKFLAAGEILTQSLKGTEGLIASLDKLGETLSPATVESTASALKETAAALGALPASHKARIAALSAMSRSRREFAERIDDMRRALAYMQAFTVNIKIVAGGIGEGEFGVFAQDIADCIAAGTEKLKSLETEIGHLGDALQTADERAGALGKKIDTLLPPLHRGLTESAEAMREHYRTIAATVEEVGALARDIRKNAGRILIALQIGDSTRQRIEHVQAGLVAARPRPDLTSAQNARIAAFVYALLSAQVAGTMTDFDREVLEIDASMARMADGARELMKLHGMAFSGGEDGRGFLHDLVARIDQASALVGQIAEADQGARATGKQTVQSAHQLSARIEEIQLLKNDVQYMALNTTLKCCQIGEIGRPLSVIAIALRDHGSELDAAAEQSLTDLAHLTATADGRTDGAQADGRNAADALTVAAGRVREARDKTEVDIASIAAMGDDVLNMLDESGKRLRFREDIGEGLERIAEDLAFAGGLLEPYTDDIAAPLAEAFAAIETHYAMAQERDVHRAFAERWSIAVAEVQAVEDDLDSVLF